MARVDRALRDWQQLEWQIVNLVSRRDRALEIGTWDAVTTVKLAKLFCLVHTVDVVLPPVVKARAKAQCPNIEFHRGDSTEVMRQMLEHGCSFDFVLVDGLHTYEKAKSDIEQAQELIRLGGLLAVDDVDWSDDVRRAATEAGCKIKDSCSSIAFWGKHG